jgi:phosphatidate phosphatase APP1
MPRLDETLERVSARMITAAYLAETGLRDVLALWARRRGWTTAALTYPGYGGQGGARVLGRLLLAPPGTDPQSRKDVPGWRRLLTLEEPAGVIEMTLGSVRRQVRADASGFIDTTVRADLSPGRAEALFHVEGRPPVPATVHVAAPSAARGVVCDIDDTVWITGLRHPLRAAWRTFARTVAQRRPVEGMADLLSRLVADEPGAPVVYLSNGPWNLAGPIARFLDGHGFPAGALLMTDWGITPRAWFRDGRAHKATSLERLAEDLPGVRWVLVGDDGEHDPEIYSAFARSHPSRIAGIALRTVDPLADATERTVGRIGEVPVVRAPDGTGLADQLTPLLEPTRTGSRP